MKSKIVYLGILTAVALLALSLFSGREQSGPSRTMENLLPQEVSGRINAADRVEVFAAGGVAVATMVKGEHHWHLEQLAGYRADWPKLQKLLSALAQAGVVEVKTDKPEYYARLGVEDIDAANAGGALVVIGIDGKMTGVLIGKAADGRQGRYVRIQDQAASALIDRDLDVPTETKAWADTNIIDIDASDVAEVEIIHPSAEQLLVTKASADQTDFEWRELPEGRELKSSWAVNSLASVLSMLNFEEVRPDQGMDWQDAVKLRLLTFSGMEIIADALALDDQFLFRLQAGHPAAAVVEDGGSTVTDSALTESVADTEKADDVAQEVAMVNQNVSGWVYSIPKYKFDAMVKLPEDLLKPLEKE